MLEIKLILCPVDFSEVSASAYRHAISLAEHYRPKLLVQHVVELWRHPTAGFAASVKLYDDFCQSLCEKGKKLLQEFVKNNTHGEIQPELAVHDGTASDSILSFALARKADVIVMGTHGRRGYDRLMLGSVTDRVMRRASCPVLAVCGPACDSIASSTGPGRVHHLSRILFCADFSENSERVLEYALSVTAEYDAELTLLHVVEEVASPVKTEEAVAAAAKQLDRLIPPERCQTLKMRTVVRTGKPYQEIIQFSREAQIDLAVFGSTTYRVIQLGPCPVLVHV